MSVMFTHAMITRDREDYAFLKFIPNALHPFDALKIILEQRIYLDYLELTSNDNATFSILGDLKKTIDLYYGALPKKLHEQNITLNNLYEKGIEVYNKLNYYPSASTKPTNLFSKATYYDLVAIFQTKNLKTYYNSLYTATMNHNFLVMWFAMSNRWYDRERYPEGIVNECAIYVPQVTLVKGSDSESNTPDNHVCIRLAPKSMRKLYIAELCDVQGICDLNALIRCFDMRPYSIDNLIGIVASFAIDHSKYIMTDFEEGSYTDVSDVCFDIVTGSSFANSSLTGKRRIPHLDLWLSSVEHLVTNGRLKTAQDNELFGELLSRFGSDQKLVNFFTKPITQISATEALAFRSSLFADFISDRFEVGMEALEEEPAPNEEVSEDLDSTTETKETIVPQIDPGKMLLELAHPSETMSDYIYRETVSHRISYLLKNPPENAMPNDLLMLKRWRSRWLYLASISCLRDFLTRVSLRLSM